MKDTHTDARASGPPSQRCCATRTAADQAVYALTKNHTKRFNKKTQNLLKWLNRCMLLPRIILNVRGPRSEDYPSRSA
eukprot:8617564-Pyramimonas_sp.AAC.1